MENPSTPPRPHRPRETAPQSPSRPVNSPPRHVHSPQHPDDSMAISDGSRCSPQDESGASQPLAAVHRSDLNELIATAADRISNEEEISSDDSSFSDNSESDSDLVSPTVVTTPNRAQGETDKVSRQLNDFSRAFGDKSEVGIELSTEMQNGLNRLQQELQDLENEYEGDDGMPPPSPDYLGGRYTSDQWERYNAKWCEERNQTVILKTTFPTGMAYDHYPVVKNKNGELNDVIKALRSIHETYTLLGPKEGFADYEEAVNVARIERDKLPAFDRFIEYDGPPWDGHADNRHHVIIDVVDYEDYQDFIATQQIAREYLASKFENYKCLLDIAEGTSRMQITNTKVFYSYPRRKMWNKPADMEVVETADREADMLRKIRPDVGGTKSLMYRGHTLGSLGHFLKETYLRRPFTVDEVGLLRHTLSIENLEQLFLEMDLVTIGPDRRVVPCRHISDQFIVELAPCMSNLKVLSFGPNFIITPEALETIGTELELLERLDISFALSPKYSQDADQHIEEEEMGMYYEYVLPECVSRLKHLIRLDIGQVCTDELDDSFIISAEAIDEMEVTLFERGGHLTQSHETTPPLWPNDWGEEFNYYHHVHAIKSVAADPKKDPDLRNIAHFQLNQMKEAPASRNRQVAADGQLIVGEEPVVIEDNLDEPPCSVEEANYSSNKRRHDEEELTPDSSCVKVTRLS